MLESEEHFRLELQAYIREWIKAINTDVAGFEEIVEGRFAKGSVFDGVVCRADSLRVQLRDTLRATGLTEKDEYEIPNCDCED